MRVGLCLGSMGLFRGGCQCEGVGDSQGTGPARWAAQLEEDLCTELKCIHCSSQGPEHVPLALLQFVF